MSASQPSKAIIVGSIVIGACVLANLGYTIFRDRAEAVIQQQRARADADHYKRVQSKEAWKQALRSIDVYFREWLTKQSNVDSSHYVHIEFAAVKFFDVSDVQWSDEHTATVRGLLQVAFSKADPDYQVFSWTTKVTRSDDGVDSWWKRSDPEFKYLANNDKYSGQPILIPSLHFRSPLVYQPPAENADPYGR